MSGPTSDIFVLKTRIRSNLELECDIDDDYTRREDVEPKPEPLDYASYRDSGLLNAYRSSTVPIEVGCLKLNLDTTSEDIFSGPNYGKHGKIKVTWHGDSGPARERSPLDSLQQQQTSRGSSGRSVNQARTSAVVRQRQYRRQRLSRREGTGLQSLRFFLSVLYYIGASPFRPKTACSSSAAFARVQKVTHWIFVSIAMLEAISRAKQKWVEFRVNPTMHTIALLGISIIIAITRIYSVRVFSSMAAKMDEVIHCAPVNNDQDMNDRKEITPTTQLKIMLSILITMSVSMAIASVVLGNMPFKSWTFEDNQRFVAYQVNQFIAVWTPNNWDNVTDELMNQYIDNPISVSLIAFAAVGDTMAYIGNIYDNLMIDFWLVLSYHVYDLQAELRRSLNNQGPSHVKADLDEIWNMYIECRTPIDEINDLFSPLLKLVHANNILGFSWLLLDSVENSISAWRVCLLVNIIKISMAYKFCWSSSQTNEKLQKELTKYVEPNGFVELNGEKIHIYVLRIEMKDHKIGLGYGDFMIQEAFLLKVICAAWSVFALFADQKEPCSKGK